MSRASVLFALAPLLLLALLALSAAAHGADAQCVHYKGTCQAQWMGLLPGHVKRRSLKRIVVPGGHDSGSNVIDEYGLSITPREYDGDPIFALAQQLALDPLTSWFMLPVLFNLTVTRREDFAQQLEQGLRALDIRLTYANLSATGNKQHQKLSAAGVFNPDAVFLSHTYCVQPLAPALVQVRHFLERNPDEIIFINVAYDWEHRVETSKWEAQLLQMFIAELGPYLAPCRADWSNVTLEQMVNSKRRVVLQFAEPFSPSLPTVCANGPFVGFWPNSDSTAGVMQRITQYVATANFSIPTVIDTVSFINTPQTIDIIKFIVRDLEFNHTVKGLTTWAKELRQPTADFLDKFFVQEQRTGISMVNFDWPKDDEIARVIAYNYV